MTKEGESSPIAEKENQTGMDNPAFRGDEPHPVDNIEPVVLTSVKPRVINGSVDKPNGAVLAEKEDDKDKDDKKKKEKKDMVGPVEIVKYILFLLFTSGGMGYVFYNSLTK